MRFVRIKYALIAAVLAVCMPVLLMACSDQDEKEPDYGVVTEEDTSLDERSVQEEALALLPRTLIKIGFVQAGHESDWRIASTKSCMETFSEENGYELYFVDADGDPEKQVEAVRHFITEQVAYILIDPIARTGWTAALKEAYHAMIPVILLNGTIDCEERYYQAWYGPDYVQEGRCAGQWLQKYLAGIGRETGMIRILIVNGAVSRTAQEGRREGFSKYMTRNRGWKILARSSFDPVLSDGRQVMESYLEKHKSVDVVICYDDQDVSGVCDALDEAGISYGTGGDVVIIAFGASRDGLLAVMEGAVHVDFESSPLGPSYAGEAVQQLEKREIFKEKNNYLPLKCYAMDSRMLLATTSGIKRMISVSKEILENKKY